MSLTAVLITAPLGAALIVAAVGYAVLTADRQPPLDIDSPVPYVPADDSDDLMAIADAVHGTEGDAFDQWLAGEVARSATVDELARRRAGRSPR